MKHLFLIAATLLGNTSFAQTRTEAMAANASAGSRSTAAAESSYKDKAATTYEYLTLTANIEKDGQLSLPEQQNQESKEEAIKSLKKKLNSTASKEEQDRLMNRYEKINNGSYTLDEQVNDLGAEGYELVSVVNVSVEELRQVKFFFKRALPKK
ncbi:MAG: hypothetical protein IPN22_09590 [Bacteroidetes bacterium]|nr:hypothetical protein [Bacteroidota bacterium]